MVVNIAGRVRLSLIFSSSANKADLILTYATSIARKMPPALMNGIYTSDPGEVSMLFALFQAKQSKGLYDLGNELLQK